MNELTFWLVLLTAGIISYELSRLISVSYGEKEMPWYMSALFHILYVLGLPGLFTIGIIDSRIGAILYDRHINQMKKLRTIAELQGYPMDFTEKFYDLDCALYKNGEEFELYAWKLHEYRKLGL